jgi:hypothetical protein
MDFFPIFTKMTGMMNFLDIASALKLIHPTTTAARLKCISELFVPCHLGENWEKAQT